MRVIRQAALFLVVAVAVALVVNAVQSRGLDLSVNQFEGAGLEHDFGTYRAEEVVQILDQFADPGSGFLLLDARNEEKYQRGHIPGAVRLDHYHLEEELPALEGRIRDAIVVVIYCNGGDCEDSILLGQDLSFRRGLKPPEEIFLYEGGMTEWQTLGHPVEKQ